MMLPLSLAVQVTDMPEALALARDLEKDLLAYDEERRRDYYAEVALGVAMQPFRDHDE